MCSPRVLGVRREDLDQPWKVENLRRSLTMLPPDSPGLCREDALLLLELLAEQMERHKRYGLVGVGRPGRITL